MKRSIATLAVGLLLLGMVGTAQAAKQFNSTVKITTYYLGAYEGQVKSQFDKCKKKRSVELWRDNEKGNDSLIGTDKTDGKGAWSVTEFGGGDFYAVARNKTGKYRTASGARKQYQCPEVTSAIYSR